MFRPLTRRSCEDLYHREDALAGGPCPRVRGDGRGGDGYGDRRMGSRGAGVSVHSASCGEKRMGRARYAASGHARAFGDGDLNHVLSVLLWGPNAKRPQRGAGA